MNRTVNQTTIISEPEEEGEETGPTESPKMHMNNSYEEVSAATGTDIPEPWSNEWASSSEPVGQPYSSSRDYWSIVL